MRNRSISIAFIWLAWLGAHTSGVAQDSYGAGREVEVNEPAYRGLGATSPIPDQFRVQNEGGSDGAGLCVIASAIQNGQTQGVPMTKGGKRSALWRYAKARPGGYSPDKLEAALNDIDPNEDWFSYYGTDLSVLRNVLAMGYPVGITYSWGDEYQGRIHHMVSAENDGRGFGMVADNNRVEPPYVDHPKHTAMTQEELEARVFDGDQYWLFGWTRMPERSSGSLLPVAGAVVVLEFGIFIAIKAVSHARSVADAELAADQAFEAIDPR